LNIASLNIKNTIITKAKELGFEQIGFAKFGLLENESAKLSTWLEKSYDADMGWIKKGFEKRKDIRLIMPDAKSVISLAFNYYTPSEHDETKPKISRYAWGKDYHKVLKRKLKVLIQHCEETFQVDEAIPSQKKIASSLRSSQFKSYVDDGPVMDKAWAVRAGLGWQGKHTNVISPDFGSFFFICSIITNIEFDFYESPIEDQCGSCTLCISACPTGAIVDEYVVDSNKCISYQTIENRGDIPDDLDLAGWIFGCDVCQDVCPYNSPKYNRVTSEPGFFPQNLYLPLDKGECLQNEGVNQTSPLLAKSVKPKAWQGTKAEEQTPLNPPFSQRVEERSGRGFATKTELESLTEEQFNTIFAESPIKRTKYKGWKRNLVKVKETH
jgi:epoxyqueuosine reductase